MTKEQMEYGEQKLLQFANRHNISKDTAIDILEDVDGFHYFWNWVNADEFLNHKLHERYIKSIKNDY